MIGPHDNYHLRGIIPRAISQIFQESREREGESLSVIRLIIIIITITMLSVISLSGCHTLKYIMNEL